MIVVVEKEKIIKEQKGKLQRYQQRRKRLCFFLFIEFLIFWIWNPDFIPGLSQWVAEVKSFLEGLLWPRDMAELDAGTYRAYIYRFWTWLEDLESYPLLEWAVPRIVPVWLMVTDIQSCTARSRIRKANKPPKEKKQRQLKKPKAPKEPKETYISIGPKVSGLYTINSLDAESRFEQLQERCRPLQERSAVLKTDRGLWVSNQGRGVGGKILPDRICSWDEHGKIEIRHKDDVLRFELYAEGPRLCVLGNDSVCLEKGVPLTIAHNNEAGNEIVDMTITWLGGIG